MKKILFIYFLFLVLHYSFSGESVLKLEINQAVIKAMESNFDLKNETIELNSKSLLTTTSWNNFYPEASLYFSTGKSFNSLENNSNLANNNINLGISVSLSFKGEYIYNIVENYQNYKKQKITYEQAKEGIILEVKKYYYELLLLKKKLELYEKNVESAKERLNLAELQYNLNSISKADKVKIEYDYKKACYELNQVKTKYTTELFAFKNLLGIKSDIEVDLISDFPEIKKINYEEILNINNNLTNNFEIQLLTHILNINKNMKTKYILSLLPSLNFSYNFNCDFNFTNNNKNYLTSDFLNKINSFTISFGLPLGYLFPFSSTQVSWLIANNEIEKAQNNLLLAQEKLKNTLITNIKLLEELESNILALEANLELAKESYKTTEMLYRNGAKGYLELKDAQNTLLEASVSLMDAKYQYITTLLEIYYILNIKDVI